MSARNVLIICTGNSCRSQMAEAILRQMAGSHLNVRSAGSHPAGYIHPLAIETMRRMNVPMNGQRSKSWNNFVREPNDIIITVCDHAGSEPCPVWPGQPATAHWSLPDPSFHAGSEESRLAAAAAVATQLKIWFEQLLSLPLDRLSPAQLKDELYRIGQT